jgi:hypothetical protein
MHRSADADEENEGLFHRNEGISTAEVLLEECKAFGAG